MVFWYKNSIKYHHIGYLDSRGFFFINILFIYSCVIVMNSNSQYGICNKIHPWCNPFSTPTHQFFLTPSLPFDFLERPRILWDLIAYFSPLNVIESHFLWSFFSKITSPVYFIDIQYNSIPLYRFVYMFTLYVISLLTPINRSEKGLTMCTIYSVHKIYIKACVSL